MSSPIESAIAEAARSPVSVPSRRADFPALHQDAHPNKPLVYLDSAATALKPQSVIDAVVSTYARDCANVHRGVHILSQRATQRYEAVRDQVRDFIGAASREEIIFTRGTTESINLVAHAWGRANLGPGDEILITELEHHSNIVPWQLIAEQTGARLVAAKLNDAGEITEEAFTELLSQRTKMVAFAHVSNALGTVLPVRRFCELAHETGAVVLVDGAQGVVHSPVDVQQLGADFYAFSGHKLYGPSGVGVLYGRRELLDAMPPWQGGGDMIDRVRLDGSTWNDLPYKFEAGTPNIAGVIGLGAAIDYIDVIGMEHVAEHEASLLDHGTQKLQAIDGLRLLGTAPDKAGVLTFVLEGIHPTDAGTFLDADGIAIRTGHHCAQPVLDHFGVTATARASLGLYNHTTDLDALADSLKRIISMLR